VSTPARTVSTGHYLTTAVLAVLGRGRSSRRAVAAAGVPVGDVHGRGVTLLQATNDQY
jgi:hypothetical protein